MGLDIWTKIEFLEDSLVQMKSWLFVEMGVLNEIIIESNLYSLLQTSPLLYGPTWVLIPFFFSLEQNIRDNFGFLRHAEVDPLCY